MKAGEAEKLREADADYLWTKSTLITRWIGPAMPNGQVQVKQYDD